MLRALFMDYAGVLTDVDGEPDREPPLLAVLRAFRERGLRTGMISNADRKADWLPDVFDVVLLSGQLGFGKPDLRIYRLAADLAGVPAADCVFVDDMRGNVRGAVAAGMVGVHHRGVARTIAELTVLFDNSDPR